MAVHSVIEITELSHSATAECFVIRVELTNDLESLDGEMPRLRV